MWASFPVLEAWVDLGAFKDVASSEIPGFNDRLTGWLPTLVEHRCSVGERGGFFERLRRGTYLAHILEHVALELQTLAGTPTGFGRTRQAAKDGVYKVALEYADEEVGRACFETARLLCLAAVQDRAFDIAGEVAKLKDLVEKTRPAPAVAAVLKAAKARRIPARLLDNSGLVQLGQGVKQQRFLNGHTGRTSAVAASVAYDRELTRTLLRAVGVPTPEGRAAADADDAWTAAQELGLPVVLRPRYASGRGQATAMLNTQAEVASAYDAAANDGWSPLVEKAAEGEAYRLLVIGDRVVAANAARCPSTDLTTRLHAEVAARAVDAARVVGLDVASVEIVARDVALPLEKQGGVVTVVTAQPDLGSFLHSVEPPPIGQALVDHLYPECTEGKAGRIPTVGVTGVNGKTTTTRLIAHIIGKVYKPVGMTCTEGIYVGDQRIMTGDCSGPKSAKVVLQRPDVQAAVLETARGGILREGLGFDRCDVAVVTNIGEGDHLGASEIDTPEQLAYVKSTVVAAVAPAGYAVLNATDPLVVDMAQYCRGAVVYFARDEAHPVLAAHREKNGRVAFVRDHQIVLVEGAKETLLVSLNSVPLTQGGRVFFHVENSLAAAAAAWSIGIPMAEIRAGLESFGSGMDRVPARFNLLDIKGVTVVLDYGHNTSALARLIETLEQFPHRWRTIVYSSSGDRRDRDMIEQGEQLGNAFDRVLIYEDTYLRGRKEGDIAGLFRQGLAKGSRVSEVQDVRGGLNAVEAALAASKPGDLLVIQPDIIDDGVEFLKRFLGEGGREINFDEALALPFPASSVRTKGTGIELVEGRLGVCVHASRAFRPGELILTGRGPFTTIRSRHSIQVDDRMHIIPDAPLRFLNHSCEPNCGLLIRRGASQLEAHALRHIEPGEELTFDYSSFEYEVMYMNGPCLCGSSGCRGKIVGYKGLPEDVREAYGIYIAEYLRELAPAEVVPVEAAVGAQV